MLNGGNSELRLNEQHFDTARTSLLQCTQKLQPPGGMLSQEASANIREGLALLAIFVSLSAIH